MYISKGGVTLNSNALTEIVQPNNSMLTKRMENLSKAEPIKIDMNNTTKPSFRTADAHGKSGDTRNEVQESSY